MRFSLYDRLNSFRHAFAGIAALLRTQHNVWIHGCACLVVVGAGLYLSVSATDWCLLVLAIVAVLATEAMNTAVEFVADVASPEFHPMVKKAKDVAAGAVLIAAAGAVVIGLLVFVPYL